MLDQLLTFILEQTAKGKIDKETAIQLVKSLKQASDPEADDIAIIGMAGRFPLANNPEEYWQNIKNGIDCTTALTGQRRQDVLDYLRVSQDGERFGDQLLENGGIEAIDTFDYQFFRLSYKEASLMDPNQRLFLETAWQAFEDAGYGGKQLAGSNTGVYVGFASNLRDMYLKFVLEADPSALPMAVVGNQAAVLPSRISYLLDLRGPSMVIDTACSSSLVSINTACEALRQGRCDMALAGGVKINLLPLDSELTRVGFESSDSKTRSFNEGADGAGYGEGVAAIVLKPLKKAIQDGDSVYAVIKGTAVNQDGNSAGLTAPNPAAQTDLLLRAWADAKVRPETIQYIETHGTGTRLGDPIEIRGIQEAFRKHTDQRQFCAIGSVKTNHGHPFEAAGVLGVIKMVKALQNRKFPPTLYFQHPNHAIPFDDSPVYVNTRLRDWPLQNTPRRCGVSAFGISGTNCHVVLEEAPMVEIRRPASRQIHLLTLSATSNDSLKCLVDDYAEAIKRHPDWAMGNLCYTANTGRRHHSHRLALVFLDRNDLLGKLKRLQTELAAAEADGIAYRVTKIVGGRAARQEAGELTERERAARSVKAASLVQACAQSGTMSHRQACEVASQYANGADIDWHLLYDPHLHTRLHLPVYPFERTRCWVEFPQQEVAFADEQEDRFFHMHWQRNELADKRVALAEQTVLLFEDERFLWRELAHSLSKHCKRLITVALGFEFCKVDDNAYVISGTEEDYRRLVADLREAELSHIVHMATIRQVREIGGLDQLHAAQIRGTYSLFYLLRALVIHGMDQDIRITLISEHVSAVTGTEAIVQPENAPLFGLAKAINQEHPGLSCRNIDIDDSWQVEDLLADMYHLHQGVSDQVAYRHGQRYTEQFSEVIVAELIDQPVAIKEGGVYLITGGLGGLGLEVAKHLAGKNRIILALVNRTELPERELWDSILLGDDPDDKLKKRIRGIRAIEELGSTVLYYQADVADEVQMRAVVADLKERHGSVNGIVHGAGIPGDGFLFKRTLEAFNRVVHPKIYGTWLLHHLTKDEPIDFFLNFSSGLSILSEPGHGDYTAANSYLDAFAAFRNRRGQKTLTINWSTWKETGMAVDYGFDHEAFFKTIGTEQALAGLGVILNKQIDRVLIGEFSYNPQFLPLIDRLPFQLSDKIRARSERMMREQGLCMVDKPRVVKKGGAVVLVGRDHGTYSYLEKRIADMYYEVLGHSEMHVQDGFFELGGDSVSLKRVYIKLDKEYPGRVKLIDLFSHTSIAALSGFLEKQLAGNE